ncbi:receptor-transporting protein 3-like [Hippoglossus hippoglossus]|uniref:receptor-transporting protein 3-like n=1 Tax=Hippoglossus hippoglossus TaxID=8267 RepID=UPI00148E7D79|nr:receptor-transporting protein 3-like [Hippoglossus hippoglossus]
MDLAEWTSNFKSEADGLLHGDTWNLEFVSSIQPEHPQPGWEEYLTQTSARFWCSQCPRGWPSNRVTVVFHMCLKDSTGTVKVMRFGQKCQNCSNAPMVDPIVEPENITILMKNLVTKIRIKCYEEDLDDLEVNSPHDPPNCDACIRGIH